MDAAEVAHEVNARIRGLAQRFDAEREQPVAFLCECGCFAFVPLTVAQYDATDGPVTATVHRVPGSR
jgi:hypothetical protein